METALIRRPPRPKPVPGKCRAGIIVTAMYVGGAERWVSDVIRATSHKVDWVGVGITTGEYGTVFGEMVGVKIFSGNMACRELGGMVDVLIVWTIKDATRYAARGIPVIAVSHSPPESEWARNFFGADGVIGATHYVGVSESAVQCLPPAARERATVINNGVDIKALQPRVSRVRQREYWGINPWSIVVGYTGRLSKEKRYHLVWQCLKYLGPEFVAVLVGDGPFIDQDRAQARSEFGDRVKLVGPTADIASALYAMDVLVIASEYESFCYSVVEAWATDLPVVSTLTGVAAKHPQLVYQVDEPPTPASVAHAVIAANLFGSKVNFSYHLNKHYGWNRFSRDWTSHILKVHEEACA